MCETSLTEYERQEVEAIRAWKNEEPGVVSQALGYLAAPLLWVTERVIPEAAIRGALDLSSVIAQNAIFTRDILRDGGVSTIRELRTKDLQLSDGMANRAHNRSVLIATAEGGATGATGLIGLAADVPAIIIIALGTIHKIGLCYGYEVENEQDRQFVYGIMAASGANSVAEKIAALSVLRSIEVALVRQTWKSMAIKAAEQGISKEAAIIGVKNLAKQIGINLTKRKALQAIPVVGGVVGASVNGWYIKEVGWAARRAYQERWLIDNHRVMEI